MWSHLSSIGYMPNPPSSDHTPLLITVLLEPTAHEDQRLQELWHFVPWSPRKRYLGDMKKGACSSVHSMNLWTLVTKFQWGFLSSSYNHPRAQTISLQALQSSPLSNMFNNQVCVLEFKKKHIQALQYLRHHFTCSLQAERARHTIAPCPFPADVLHTFQTSM